MTPEQYWDGDPSLTASYREAERIKRRRVNEELWLQGMYVYDAICCASPILRDFAKSGTRPAPYPDRPYPIDEKSKERKKQDDEYKEMLKGKNYMDAFMKQFNERKR